MMSIIHKQINANYLFQYNCILNVIIIKPKKYCHSCLYAEFEFMLVPVYNTGYYLKCSYGDIHLLIIHIEDQSPWTENGKNENIVSMISDPKVISDNGGFFHICEKPFTENDVILKRPKPLYRSHVRIGSQYLKFKVSEQLFHPNGITQFERL